MILYAFAILILGAALCFGLSRALPTRALGAVAAALCLLAAAPALAGAPPDAGEATVTLLTLGEGRFALTPWLALGERGLAAGLLAGSATALLALAGAIAGTVRGFGALFGWALLCVAAALLSLAAAPLSLAHPLAWAVLAVAGYGALRASGTEGVPDAPPVGLTLGLAASALLTVAILGAGDDLAAGRLPAGPVAAGLLATLALTGCAPLLTAREEAVAGPAPLGALIFGLCAPAAGLGWLLRALAALPVVPTGWAIALGLLGAVGALACAAGALGERRLRPILAWSAGAQASLVLAAAGLAGPLAALAGPALLLSLMLTAALGAAAAVSFERAVGDDDYTAAAGPAPRLAAAFWALGAAAALGLPPLWGFWGRLWLLEAALDQQPWLAAPLLAGSALLALGLAAPLAGLWGAAGESRGRAGWGEWAPGLLALAPLLALGAAPWLAWERWLRAVTFAPPDSPLDARAQAVALGAGALLALAAALIAGAKPTRAVERDPDERPVRLAPDTLGRTLRPLALLANPRPLLRGLWGLLERSSELLRFLVGMFEQRYYLLGVLAALITIMLLMAQGL